MTLGLWVTAQDVRDYANFEKTTGRYSDAQIGSNIRAAERYLQKETSRQWEGEHATKTFTTYGQAQISIPDLRAATSVSLNTASLTSNETYWLVPSKQDQSVSIAIQLRPFMRENREGRWYYSVPDWFDRGLDLPEMRWGYDTGLPNDLSITGDWGWSPVPEDVLHATKILAAWYTFRADALLSGAKTSPDGAIFDMSSMPSEVSALIVGWQAGTQLVAVGG